MNPPKRTIRNVGKRMSTSPNIWWKCSASEPIIGGGQRREAMRKASISWQCDIQNADIAERIQKDRDHLAHDHSSRDVQRRALTIVRAARSS
jgi:hypothetical protein